MRRLQLIAAWALVNAFAACDTVAPLVARTDELMLYVVLTPDTLTLASPLTAVLATTGTPTALEFRSAEWFIMRRTTDLATFAWREVPASTTTPDGHPRVVPFGGNYLLPEQSGPDGPGRQALAPGQSYVLEVATGGRIITGAVTMPERPAPVLIQRDTDRVVVWPRAAAAAAYLLQIDTDVLGTATVTDTSYVLRDDRDARSLPARPHFGITETTRSPVDRRRTSASRPWTATGSGTCATPP